MRFYHLCLTSGDWAFVFSVSLVLFSTLFPGGAAEIDSFGSADPLGLLAFPPSCLWGDQTGGGFSCDPG